MKKKPTARRKRKTDPAVNSISLNTPHVAEAYLRIGHTEPFTWRAVTQKVETQNKKEDQISTPHPPQIMPNPRSFPKSGCRVFDFFEKK